MSDAPTSNGVLANGHHSGHDPTPDAPNGVQNASPDSPATPVDDSVVPEAKIDVDYTAAESDMRNLKVEPPRDSDNDLRDASTVPQVQSPSDPDSIPVNPPQGSPPPPNGELLEDVKMAEQVEPVHADADVVMADSDAHQPNGLPNGHASPPVSSIPAVSSSNTAVDSLAESSPYSININVDDDKPPPSKRARKYSDAEKASVANTATPPPASVSPAPPNGEASPRHNGFSTINASQHRFLVSSIRTLKRSKDSAPFIHPVDPVAMSIPHYPSIIKHPMSFSVIESKLAASNPMKPDPNPANPRYHAADEVVADVRLIFSNCVTFNGPDHAITQMGKRLEETLDKMMKSLPPPDEVKPIVKKSVTPPPPPPPAPVVKKPVRKGSTAVPVIRRTDDPVGRPKREIHPPPPKDLPYADIPKKRKAKISRSGSGQADQLKFCDATLKQLNKKTHYSIAHPFYEPVDWVRLELPAYPKIVKKPMDLATMRKKLDAGEYTSADKFHDDFKLMIRNCFSFNPSGTPVNLAGQELQRLFDERWKSLPPLVVAEPSDDEEEELEEDEDEHARMIADMETQIENMNRNLEYLKKSKMKDKKEKKEKKVKEKPVASSSKKSAPKPPSTKKKNKKQPVSDDDVLSFEQKKDLSDTIAKLDGAKLEKVIQIIHEGVPEIRDSTEEIELEIDQLPSQVLTKLYNFVIRPMRPTATKRSRTGKGTGTGGLKRKSMDEDVEAEKIRVLEERMALFDGGKGSASGTTPSRAAAGARGDDSEHSSDSSSDDSSGSDSE
ncbi:hypothetical protein EUX98_g7164 [Antrodiella citrinella]|uniref:Bromodomain-containing protein n=1 Tax=Antrodiella citrinella TaxID=2447956 RepID=A0A4S4MP57_9APHY|nr:hypothetical protein EUX98_g7164 [Antrodiella citrinella]